MKRQKICGLDNSVEENSCDGSDDGVRNSSANLGAEKLAWVGTNGHANNGYDIPLISPQIANGATPAVIEDDDTDVAFHCRDGQDPLHRLATVRSSSPLPASSGPLYHHGTTSENEHFQHPQHDSEERNIRDAPVSERKDGSHAPLLETARPLATRPLSGAGTVVRPIALKVVRPVPKSAAAAFYDESYRHGLSGDEVHAAVMESHEWHRKWTLQEEENHTMPHDNHYQHQASARSERNSEDNMEHSCSLSSSSSSKGAVKIPAHYAYEREMGAKNPSPEDKDSIAAAIRKRRLLDDSDSADGSSSLSATTQSSPIQAMEQDEPIPSWEASSNRRGTDYDQREQQTTFAEPTARPAVVEPDEEVQVQRPAMFRPQPIRPPLRLGHVQSQEQQYAAPTPQKPYFGPEPPASHANRANAGIVRPVALRITRPAKMSGDESAGSGGGGVPKNITKNHNGQNQPPLSPLTLPSTSSSYRQLSRKSSSSGTQNNVLGKGNGDGVENGKNSSSGSGSNGISPEGQGLTALDYCEVPMEIMHPVKPWDAASEAQRRALERAVAVARDNLLHALAVNGGNFVTEEQDEDAMSTGAAAIPRIGDCMAQLQDHFENVVNIDTRSTANQSTEGLWLTLTKPTFFGNLGDNDNGDPMYTLGRMAFDMFSPTSLVCSLQGNFNSIKRIKDGPERAAVLDCVPKALRDEVQNGDGVLRTYNVITAFTIEPSLPAYPHAPNKDVHRPIRGVMTTFGYTLADPDTTNRHSVWITGGQIEPNDDPVDRREWIRLFTLHPPKHKFSEQAKLLAVKLLMGAKIPKDMDVNTGVMEYVFTRPLGGHGIAYVDTVYVDNGLRIVRGHRGTTFVFSKMNGDGSDTTDSVEKESEVFNGHGRPSPSD